MNRDEIKAEMTFQPNPPDGETFPFFESEDGDITGYGHQDPAEFAAAVNRYDRECGVTVEPADEWTADVVGHHYAVILNDDRLRLCPADEPDAFPVTTIWGQR